MGPAPRKPIQPFLHAWLFGMNHRVEPASFEPDRLCDVLRSWVVLEVGVDQ